MKIDLFSLKFHWSLFPMVQLIISHFDSDNTLAPRGRQVIIWTNDGLSYWRIDVSLGLIEAETKCPPLCKRHLWIYFLEWNCCTLIQISLQIDHKDPFDNKTSLVQIIAWYICQNNTSLGLDGSTLKVPRELGYFDNLWNRIQDSHESKKPRRKYVSLYDQHCGCR